ncbi:MAG TPA: phosphate ABC transporter permease PstA [Vicinamibacterales bacterium]|jgi:phosphate transport system permease protein|nr:phosphate ABC transporter permease PstA [Vicinamibacterales bacterium]
MSSKETVDPFAGVDLSQLERSLRRPRTLVDFGLTALVSGMTLISLGPLLSVVVMLVWRGGRRLSVAAVTQLPPAPLEQGGGFGNAVVGTLIIVALAVLVTVPLGLLTAIYLAQAGNSRFSATVRFCAKVLTGFPSILAGVFAYGAIVLTTGGYSAFAGAVALSILMLPTIILTSEDAIRMVPARMTDAAVGMGATRTQVIWMVLLPTAIPGILTGIMLAVARAAGETAPLLFTALFSNYWLWSRGHVDLKQPTASLAVLIYNFAGMPFQNQVELAWAAALVLVLLVLGANLIGQALSPSHAHQT